MPSSNGFPGGGGSCGRDNDDGGGSADGADVNNDSGTKLAECPEEGGGPVWADERWCIRMARRERQGSVEDREGAVGRKD